MLATEVNMADPLPDLLRQGRQPDNLIELDTKDETNPSAVVPIQLVLSNGLPGWIDRLQIGLIEGPFIRQTEPVFVDGLASFVQARHPHLLHHREVEQGALKPFEVRSLVVKVRVEAQGNQRVHCALYVATDEEAQWYALSFLYALHFHNNVYKFRAEGVELTRAKPPIPVRVGNHD
jgi:hypothetical protein